MTDKQKLFIDEYLKCMSVTKAYKKVYTNVRSDAVARSAGNRLLSKSDVKA
ncbi:terminase small subunit [uncultured Dubosiella sp.]|uniref:terminase small subunit n=1 Tax=uncultured Dubosiella sp. TaxID=1937011 RepID=UPI00259AB6BE|nr:terminase small subunit [uncultured Dubosiella sp.]